MEAPSIDPIKKNTIDVYGLIGKFELQGKPIRVNYFSTKASSVERSAGEFSLLRELKPMRERVSPSELKDLSSLLQRDLSDARVAMELIPYLKGISDVAFFPAILAVLIPSGFITNESNNYPSPTKVPSEGQAVTKFEDCWTLTAFKAGESYGPLGMLSIDSSRTDIIVLDGQHRANAFRFMCGVFGNDDIDIHSAFYQDLQAPETFEAELPVTLVWFESETAQVEPTLISRRLFVDVNNSAKKVSKSRNILLDDREITSLMTRFFYSGVAQASSFKADNFSLLHSAFDIDTDVAKRAGNTFTLTNPEIIEYLISWLMFDFGSYDALNMYRVSREMPRSTVIKFTKEFKDPSFNGSHIEVDNDKKVVIKNIEKISDFEAEFNKKVFPALFNVFNDFNLFRHHYSACQKISEWRSSAASPTERDVWDNVFCGGEGLYFTLLYSKDEFSSNQRLSDLRSAVDSIEARLSRERTALFPGCSQPLIDQAFESIRTKAFQVGLFMALEKFKVENSSENLLDACEEFLQALNRLEPNDWITVLTEIKSALIPGVDPKSWPAYQKLILRVIQAEKEFYNSGNFMDSPDGRIFERRIKDRFNSWLTTEEIDVSDIDVEALSESLIESWALNSKEYVSDLFTQASLEPIEAGVDHLKFARDIVKRLVPR